MHAIDLAELASTFVRMAAPLTNLQLPPRRSAAQQLWLVARYRQENWLHDLAQHRDAIARPGTSRRTRLWADIIPVIQEVLLSEPLSRAVAYLASLWDSRHIDNELAPLALSTLAAHIEARNRCLHLIVFGQGLAVEDAVKINRLRRNLETYSDQLLACLPAVANPGLFAFEPRLLAQLQAKLRPVDRQPTWLNMQAITLAEHLWQSVNHDLDWRSASARLNYQLSGHTLGLLPAACFDSAGVPHSANSIRLLQPSLEGHVGPHCEHPLFKFPPCSQQENPRLKLLTSSRRLSGE
ncbi:MAG: hypothetical protein KDA51_17310 [Planctomycetales bacterium]|nr:hypothetical protein [Planctomycetales bacterium]